MVVRREEKVVKGNNEYVRFGVGTFKKNWIGTARRRLRKPKGRLKGVA